MMKRKILIPIPPEEPAEEDWSVLKKTNDLLKEGREDKANQYIAMQETKPTETIDDGKIIMLLYPDKVVIFFHDGTEPHILKRKINVRLEMAKKRMQLR